jgi:hypothetical protein
MRPEALPAAQCTRHSGGGDSHSTFRVPWEPAELKERESASEKLAFRIIATKHFTVVVAVSTYHDGLLTHHTRFRELFFTKHFQEFKITLGREWVLHEGREERFKETNRKITLLL